jgi:microcystin degradation protein MlrC
MARETQQHSGPRVALLGFHLESNGFAPVSEERHFRSLCYFEGEDIAREARKSAPALPAEVPAFYREMDALGAWQPVPVIVTACEPGGPV